MKPESNTILVRSVCWGRIRELFSESEKELLRAAKCGDSICPEGAVIDEDKLNPALEFKLHQAISEWRNKLP